MSPTVTLVGGFFGAGKTSLLHHFLTEHATAPAALFIEDIGPVPFDARAMRGLGGAMQRTQDLVREIPGTAEASWWDDALRQLDSRYRQILVEVGGMTNPARLRKVFEARGFDEAFIRVICIVDALDFHQGLIVPSQRKLSVPFLDFLCRQIADATDLVLNKCDLIGVAERSECINLLREINPRARLIETAYGELPAEFWSEHKNISSVTSHPPESSSEEMSGLTTTLYRIHRPFHPARFWDWFEAEHADLLRVKGLVWLATRNLLVGGVSRTRWQNSCGGAGIWWAALPREEWSAKPEVLARMQETWREPYGDRRQELLLIGDKNRLPAVVRALESCLLTTEEFAKPPREWTLLPDPFPEWDID